MTAITPLPAGPPGLPHIKWAKPERYYYPIRRHFVSALHMWLEETHLTSAEVDEEIAMLESAIRQLHELRKLDRKEEVQ